LLASAPDSPVFFFALEDEDYDAHPKYIRSQDAFTKPRNLESSRRNLEKESVSHGEYLRCYYILIIVVFVEKKTMKSGDGSIKAKQANG
jgi:hypothetical protein